MYQKNKTFRVLLRLAASISLFLATTQYVFASSENSISVVDTVANFETVITTRNAKPHSEVFFSVEKPDAGSLRLKGFADERGIVKVVVPDTSTKVAGIYTISQEGSSEETSFTVFPSEMDIDTSDIYSAKGAAAADSIDYGLITVRIVDEFFNPLAYHEVQLVSSRSSDQIIERSSETDTSGIATFTISSTQPGISVVTATDLTAEKVILQRLTIPFYKTHTKLPVSVGGDPDKVLVAQAGQSVARLKIENLPASVRINDTVSFTISAVDAQDKVISSYGETILFSATDLNAEVPKPYTFKVSDQGSRTFNLALTFRTPGTQKLTVQEQGNGLIKGEKTIEVLSSQRSSLGQVRITKPAVGTYSVNTLEIAGEATPNAKVKLFDNGQQISEVESNTSGRFSYTTSLLADGKHTFHAESDGIQSQPVPVTIDSTPAQVEQVDITKTELAPGETTTISIRSDPDLTSMQATLGDVISDLEPDPQNPGLYRGTLTAPAKDGDYTINVILTDKIGNVSSTVEVGKIHVDASLREGGGVASGVPSVVTGLKALPGNSRITLSWQPSKAEAGIAFYRIYYGTDPGDLNLVANTKDSAVTWYIPNLRNGTTYFFQLVGVDREGNEGDTPSALVSASPSLSAREAPVLCDPAPCPPDAPTPRTMPEDGPEVIGIIVASLLGTSFVRFWRKKRKNI